MGTTATQTNATETLADLTRKLDYWERNLRANYAHYESEGRERASFAEQIDAQLGLIDSVRDVIDPGWSDR